MTPLGRLSLVGVLLLGAVSSQTVDRSVEELTNKNADFAARLYRAVASRTDDNVLLATMALSTALAALLSSTSGATQEQLLQGLSLAGLDPQTLPDVFQNLRAAVLQGSVAANLKQGVTVLPSQTFQLPSSYQDLVKTKFGVDSQTLTFTEPEATSIINQWAREQTGAKVQQLVTFVDPQTQLLLAAVASYQSRFSPSFNASFTHDERFYVSRYEVVMVPMMFRADKYFLAYDRSLKAGVLKLPMADGTAMLVVLPDEDVDIIDVEEEVTGEKIRAWIRQLKKTKLEVQLPRFLLERAYSLRDALQSLALTTVFQDDAEIVNMGAEGPKLTQVHQKSVMTVDESSDSADAGGGANAFSTPPPRLTVNRPFVFVVYHQATRSVLFMGRVRNPAVE